MTKWTNEQIDAINKKDSNIIVSAGAGSGKTAVLSERVIRILKEKVHINELLILTFTKLAAHEMKDRIRRSIKKEAENDINLKKELERKLALEEYLEDYKLTDNSTGKEYDTKEKRIYMPYIITIKDGKIVDAKTTTSKTDDVEEEKQELNKMYSEMLSKIYPPSNVCTSENHCN